MTTAKNAGAHEHFPRWANRILAHHRHTELYQTATMDALLAGVYDGDVTIGELLSHGDFGLGTFNQLDGEMVILDGVCHHLRSDGSAVRAGSEERTPFAAVTWFRSERTLTVSAPTTWSDICARVDTVTGSANLIYALKVVGRFDTIRTRTVRAQTQPYPRLVDAAEGQAETSFADLRGTLVGFRMPDGDEGISVAGYHLHFLDEAQSRGGHCLDFQMSRGTVDICTISDMHLSLPRTPQFLAAALGSADSAAQIRKAEGGHDAANRG
ncbi:acetolactate decarboxylase [Mycolicibacterium helvum]|uniref:Alpha-acetolactate decarboxylase n=1 Tax=Mycolicibacterium helvum TaxID=1534349 RepID=A0A7I7TFS9_9MYCO|nr:acetolactate decarboxylase [Mycolicibacterium helvum]BBY67225.1 alpha-acetolactate decarboxylase [Mycolicibacterium helvum]